MNLILLFKKDFINSKLVRLKKRRFNHIVNVHKALVGDTLNVGIQDGLTGSGEITYLSDSELQMKVFFNTEPPSPLPLTLILAMPRPKVLKRILLNTTSMGVKKIIILNAYRVEKSFWQSPVLKDENILTQLILGLEQAKDTVMPKVLLRRLFKPFVEDELPSLIQNTLPIVAHPGSADQCPHNIKNTVTLVVGPEGGFIPYEIEKLIECGFTTIHLGQRILRVETAIPAIISKLFL